jgi:hypothetical protein
LAFRADTWTNLNGNLVLSLRCPDCGQNGTFDSMGINDLQLTPSNVTLALRRCPNPECHAHVYMISGSQGGIVASYPPELLDFDSTNIPTAVTQAMEEAIKCHATECYMASAVMVRKTLEELCADRGAEGDNLKQRVAALGDKVVLPKDLLDGLDDLRLLGNDAAHVESKEYDNIGKEEVEIGIEFATEVLKATYQLSDLVTRLRALKAQQT